MSAGWNSLGRATGRTPLMARAETSRPAWSLSEAEFWQRQREVIREALAELAMPAGGALLTVEEAAQLCRCSTRHIRRLRSEGLPVVLLGQSPRFERDALLAWLRVRSVR
jgi:excisionase family DNA binding protein